MNRAEYISWHKDWYGFLPKPAFLDKHFPISEQEEHRADTDIPDPTPEELEKFWKEE